MPCRAAAESAPAGWTQGRKDQDLVLLLCRGNRHAGANVGRATGKYLNISVDEELQHHLAGSASGEFDVRLDPVPAVVALEVWTTAAHELAHSLGPRGRVRGRHRERPPDDHH
jgi:hypothetical protein